MLSKLIISASSIMMSTKAIKVLAPKSGDIVPKQVWQNKESSWALKDENGDCPDYHYDLRPNHGRICEGDNGEALPCTICRYEHCLPNQILLRSGKCYTCRDGYTSDRNKKRCVRVESDDAIAE